MTMQLDLAAHSIKLNSCLINYFLLQAPPGNVEKPPMPSTQPAIMKPTEEPPTYAPHTQAS